MLAGLPDKYDQHVDGISFATVIKNVAVKRAPGPLHWHYPHYHGSTWTPGAAIRDGQWKLIEFYHYGGHELYNLADDLGEKNNVAEDQPEIVKRLADAYEAHIADIKRDEKRMEAFDAFFAVLEVSSGCWILSKAKNAMKRALYLPTATGNRWEQNTYCTL